ncbi:hexosaminidase D-like [Penaeus indicus]|uniref:hexosaminidase D-like n=1 Tax=Penaeus indicus TaxID=29960 RepID=UPI00300D51EE
MFPRRGTRLLTMACFVAALILMLYMISSPSESSKVDVPEPFSARAQHRSALDDSSDLLTQSPENIKKQKEYESKIFAKIHKMTAEKEMRRKMNHDPLGVVLHKKPSAWEGPGKVIEEQSAAMGSDMNGEMHLKHKIVHLDLKGAPPKVEYLKKLFPLLSSFGATGLLIEYEDMFPYWGKLESLSAYNAYAKGDIADILEVAKKNNLEVIPLIQTFGHMEYVLKLKEFADLREVPNYPQVICPTNNGTIPLIRMMIDQIVEMHPDLNWLHIGSDEVYNLGECSRCQHFLMNQQFGKNDLFLHHVKTVARYVKETHDIQPIMWDDEFRKVPLRAIQNAQVGQLLEIMVWKYGDNIMVDLRSDIWEKYSAVFSGIWVASAFKGATRPESYITNINDRLTNHKEWMEVLGMYKSTIPFRGIVLTGWQRFDHFSILCELLPQAIPSLAVNLMYIAEQKADHGALARVGDVLKCNSFLNLDLQYLENPNKCDFPGSAVYEVSQRLYILKKEIDVMLHNSHVTGWVTDYNIENNFASPQHVEQGLQDLSMLLFDYNKLMKDAETALSDVFDEYTVKEWIFVNMNPTLEKLKKFYASSTKAMEKTDWPRRPLKFEQAKDL